MGSHSEVDLFSTLISPALGNRSRLISLRVVVLPQPDLPSKTSVSPCRTEKVRWEITGAAAPAWEKLTSRNSTSGLLGCAAICLRDSKSKDQKLSEPGAVATGFRDQTTRSLL